MLNKHKYIRAGEAKRDCLSALNPHELKRQGLKLNLVDTIFSQTHYFPKATYTKTLFKIQKKTDKYIPSNFEDAQRKRLSYTM